MLAVPRRLCGKSVFAWTVGHRLTWLAAFRSDGAIGARGFFCHLRGLRAGLFDGAFLVALAFIK